MLGEFHFWSWFFGFLLGAGIAGGLASEHFLTLRGDR